MVGPCIPVCVPLALLMGGARGPCVINEFAPPPLILINDPQVSDQPSRIEDIKKLQLSY